MPAELHWIERGRLAGSAQPGMFAPMDTDLHRLAESGISLVVSLLERPVPRMAEIAAELDPPIAVDHFAIRDMSIPTPRAAIEQCAKVVEHLERGGGVLYHCRGGMGRTGLMLACTLVSLGAEPADALDRVRLVWNRYVQTTAQEQFIHHYAEALATP